MKKIAGSLLFFLRLYQRWISPMLGDHCRFYPSCSQYVIDSIEAEGLLKGLLRGVYRLCRCHPLSSGGVDTAKGYQHG